MSEGTKITLVLASGERFVCEDPEHLEMVKNGRDIALILGIPATAADGRSVSVEGPHVAYWFYDWIET